MTILFLAVAWPLNVRLHIDRRLYHKRKQYDASDRDFRAVFGWEDDPHRRNFAVGQPLDMDVPVCIDLDRFVERSNGVFGKSGTGKSFLTRLLLSGII